MYSWFFRNTFWRLWEWQQHFDIRNMMRTLQAQETDADAIKQRKENLLAKLLTHTYKNVPFYKQKFEKNGIKPEDIQIKNLSDLPVLTVHDIKHHMNDLTARNAIDWRLQASSGSTGEPKRYKIDNKALSWAYASLYRFWGWFGFQLGERWGHMKSDTMTISLPKKLKSAIFRVLWMPSRVLDDSTIYNYLKRIKKAKLNMLRANPSIAYILADYIVSNEIKDIQIPTLQTHGATLYPEWRKRIETAFQGKVVDGYGAEGMHIAHQCERTEHYHISENVILEVVDGNIILTNLVNYVQPFIRYSIKDLGTLKAGRCPCGRGHELLKEIIGRSTDVCRFRDGTILIPHFWTHIFSPCVSFAAWQVLQPDYNHIIINLVKSDQYNIQEEKNVYKRIRDTLRSDVDLQFEHTEEIPLPKSGKHRYVISDVEV